MLRHPTISLLACTEPGLLEVYAAVMFYTLRQFGGTIGNCQAFAVAPRPKLKPSAPARTYYQSLNVQVIEDDLNVKFANYPLANKPISAAYIESAIDCDIVVFLDSDTLIVGEPNALLIGSETDASAVPVFGKGIGSSGPDDPNDQFWMKLYKICGTSGNPYTKTCLLGEKIRAYYNTGVVVTRRTSGVMTLWRDNMFKLLESGLRPDVSGYMVEQTAFAGTVHGKGLRFSELPYSHNYAVHAFKSYRENGQLSPEDAKIWHHTNRLRRSFSQLNVKIQKYGFKTEIIANFVDDLMQNYPKKIARNASWHRTLRQKLKLGHRVRALACRSSQCR